MPGDRAAGMGIGEAEIDKPEMNNMGVKWLSFPYVSCFVLLPPPAINPFNLYMSKLWPSSKAQPFGDLFRSILSETHGLEIVF